VPFHFCLFYFHFCLQQLKMNPKTAQVVKVPIKPLSLHHRLYSLENADRAMNTLKLTGGFTLAQMHQWLSMCFPEVPGRVQENICELTFRNAFLGSVVICTYQKGEAVFRSDSMSTIAIIKEVVTKEATARKVKISIQFDLKEETIPGYLNLIHPKLEAQIALARKVELIDAIKEIKSDGSDSSWMTPEYLEIVENAEIIRKQFKQRPRALEYLSGIVTDFYVDYHKFRGHDEAHRIPQLIGLLQNYQKEALLAFFLEGQ